MLITFWKNLPFRNVLKHMKKCIKNDSEDWFYFLEISFQKQTYVLLYHFVFKKKSRPVGKKSRRGVGVKVKEQSF